MAALQYLNYAKNHPYLKELVQDERGKYEPFYKLGERVKDKVAELLRIRGRRENELSEYIPFLNNDPGEVKQNHQTNLRKLGWPDDQWPFAKDSKILRSFWYCYAKFKYDGKFRYDGFVKLDILDLLSQFVGLRDFGEFVHVEFSCPDGLVIALVNNTTTKDAQIKDNLKLLLLNLIENENLPISGNINGAGGQRIPSANTFSEAKEIAIEDKADLVIFVNGTAGDFVSLNCHAFNEVWAQHHGSWEKKIRIHEIINDEDKVLQKKIQHTLYWCLSHLYFFKRRLQLSCDYLTKAKRLKLDTIEVPFRLGVLHDLLEKPNIAKTEYLRLLTQIGVEDAAIQLKHLIETNENQPTNNGNYIKIEGNMIKLDDIYIGLSVDHVEKNMMYFEIVRTKLFSLLREKLPRDAYERTLDKITKNSKLDGLAEKYKPMFGEAFFEMGMVLIEKFQKGEDVDLDNICNCFEKAVSVCTKERIHTYCFEFFGKFDYLQKIKNVILENHRNRSDILAIYSV
ncbi:hypothetical protein [Cyclobacterium xiamenense]|uniref:hypothetical protein n=1 Tax=Cyclobacterium xiamenense TaxID=1297121 RepID=UPI0012B92B0A|nr:hypothetical protein [Cyclobacterium xiamenense]